MAGDAQEGDQGPPRRWRAVAGFALALAALYARVSLEIVCWWAHLYDKLAPL